MKKILILILFSTIIYFISTSCDNEDLGSIGSNVELYLIESFETYDNSFQIIESSVKTKNTPIVEYSDFVLYNSKDYTFEISNSSKEKIENIELSLSGIAFAITVDSKLIYTGYFWPSYSSMSCDWIVIDPTRLYLANELEVALGYPGIIDGEEIVDKRNDSAILEVFRQDNKLIE